MAERKNFSYGEIWKSKLPALKKSDQGRVLTDPAKFTSNGAFLDYLKQHGYRFYLDYGYQGAAHTEPDSKRIVVNANYSDKMIEVLLQHELGHLMLFDVNQFVSVSNDTLRSVISKVIYTADHVRTHGVARLLKVENIIQDIIIETVTNGDCVCHNGLSIHGERMGVKHLDRLESAKHIAQESCRTLLSTPPGPEAALLRYAPGFEGVLKGMIQGLDEDMEEIGLRILSVARSTEHIDRKLTRRVKEISKLQIQLEKLDKRLRNPKTTSQKLRDLRDRLEAQLLEARSEPRLRADEREAMAEKERELNRLAAKLQLDAELKELFEEELKLVPKPEEGLMPGSGIGDEKIEGEGEGSEASKELHANLTDHLAEDQEAEEQPGHSYDCGFPHPITVDRSEAYKNENFLKKINTDLKLKRVRLQEDDQQNVVSNRVKLPESELTYLRSAKKEWDQTDMLKGKRKLRASGVNVLVGLDISGSMVTEWTTKFAELSAMVKKLQETLAIDNIYYFTYNHRLVEHSRDLDELKLRAGGGNAFGYVYQQLMEQLPMMQKNEIILVTDCGDNLGFKLNDCCVAERNGVEIQNHVSIVDTEGAGFYDRNGLEESDWSLHRSSDEDLFEALKANIENLIDA